MNAAKRSETPEVFGSQNNA